MKRQIAMLSVLIAWGTVLPLQAADKDSRLPSKISKPEQAVVDLTNAERVKEKLQPLKPNGLLFAAARGHARNMARQQKLDHVLDGKNPFERVNATGYKRGYVGENIAYGAPLSPKAALKMWMNSPPHKKNILTDKYEEIGVGIAKASNGDLYYVQVFGTEGKAQSEEDEPEDKCDASALEKAKAELLELTNQARVKEKVPPLKSNAKLSKVAEAHAANMARQNKMEHKLDGKEPAQRIEEGGYDYMFAGENLAFSGELAVREVFDGWMNSKVHREHLLSADFKEVGFGVARNDKGEIYYAQVFGTERKKE